MYLGFDKKWRILDIGKGEKAMEGMGSGEKRSCVPLLVRGRIRPESWVAKIQSEREGVGSDAKCKDSLGKGKCEFKGHRAPGACRSNQPPALSKGGKVEKAGA